MSRYSIILNWLRGQNHRFGVDYPGFDSPREAYSFCQKVQLVLPAQGLVAGSKVGFCCLLSCGLGGKVGSCCLLVGAKTTP